MLKQSRKKWYAAYTKSCKEKIAARKLEDQDIEYYLPLYKTIRQWSDRKKKVEVPLISSYIFVHINEKKESLKVLQTYGIVSIVRFEGKPVPIPDWQIKNLKIAMGAEVPVQQEEVNYTQGEEVHITHGPLMGLRGTIVNIHGKHKLVLSISALNYQCTIDINPAFVEKI